MAFCFAEAFLVVYCFKFFSQLSMYLFIFFCSLPECPGVEAVGPVEKLQDRILHFFQVYESSRCLC